MFKTRLEESLDSVPEAKLSESEKYYIKMDLSYYEKEKFRNSSKEIVKR